LLIPEYSNIRKANRTNKTRTYHSHQEMQNPACLQGVLLSYSCPEAYSVLQPSDFKSST